MAFSETKNEEIIDKSFVKKDSTPYTPANRINEIQDEVPDPEDFYKDNQQISESKEKYEPLKVYEVKNINEVWFWKKSLKTDLQSFTVNWPLFWSDNKPVWWYIDNWNKLKDFIDPTIGWWNFAVDNWVFGLWTDWKLHLIPYENIKNNNISFQRAFQNWPILIVNGKNIRESWTSTSKYNRSGIWFTPEWKTIIIYSDQPLTFKEFAKLFVDRGCNNAIYLDGWSAAGYEDKTGPHWQLALDAIKLQFFHQEK